ncbi:hypothetical protein [Microbacterium lacticum]
MTMLIPVAAPRLWWRTTAGNVRRWVPGDPDIEDGHQRHADRDAQRWPLIASVVARVGDALAAGAWQQDPDVEGYGLVALDGYPGDLTRTEQDIVAAWFRSSEAVQFDPWFEPLTNGRHRLWATMPHFGAGLIPIRGGALGYANPADTEVMGAGWADVYAVDLEELDGLGWFDVADPLNATFRAALVTAASGTFPSTADPTPPAPAAVGKRRWWPFR